MSNELPCCPPSVREPASIDQAGELSRDAGLITGERHGTWIYRRARPEILAQLSTVLVHAQDTA